MENNNYKKRNLLITIFINFKENSSSFPIIYLFYLIFNFCDLILIIDIIFNYKRNFLNLYHFLYLGSPLFYFEMLNSYLSRKKYEEYHFPQKDQIFKIQLKYFNVNPIKQKYFKNLNEVQWILIALIFLLIICSLIKSNIAFFKYLKKFCSLLLYILIRIFGKVILLLFNRYFIIQFCSEYNEFKINFDLIINLIKIIIYNIFLYYFYIYNIYAYYNNDIFYFNKDNNYLFQFSLEEISIILIVFRFESKYSILFQLIWSLLYLNIFFSYYKLYINQNGKKFIMHVYIIIILILFSFFIARFVAVFYSKYIDSSKEYKILEIVLIFLISLILFFFINDIINTFSLSLLKKLLLEEKNNFFEGLFQLFFPLKQFYKIKLNSNRLVDKFKNDFFSKYKDEIKNHFCFSDEDYNILTGNNKQLMNSFMQINIGKNNVKEKNTTEIIELNEFNIVISVLLEVINYFYKIAKEKNSEFGKNTVELLTYYKILIYYIYDEKSFRAEFYLQKFLYSKNFEKSDLLMKSIFYYLNYNFNKKEKKNEENSMEYMIYFNLLNIEYIKIVKTFKRILISFSKPRNEIIKIIDKESDNIGNSLNKIIGYFENSYDSLKIKEQPENEKFKLIEDILFNANYDKSFDFFDLNSLDTIVEKNNYFLLKYENSNFIIKKAPLLFYDLTGFKTTKFYNVPCTNIYPYLLRKVQGKIIKKSLLEKKLFKEENILETTDHYIINVKFHFSPLPSYKSDLYILCTLDQILFPNDINYMLIQSNGNVLSFGIFYKNYFGINSSIKRFNIINIFGIKDFDTSIETQKFEINLTDLLTNFKTQLIKDSGFQNNEISVILKKIRDNFKSKILKIELNIKKKFEINSEELFLINIIFSDLIFLDSEPKKELPDTIEPHYDFATLATGTTMTGYSSSSILNNKVIKESTWNISNKKKETFTFSETAIDRISFFYNLVLIIIAIIICIYVKYYSTVFNDDYIKMLTLRELSSEYLTSSYFVSNMIKLEGSDKVYDQLNEEYTKNLASKGYNITLADFYQINFKNSALKLTSNYEQFKNNYSDISKKSQMYKAIMTQMKLLTSDGKIETITYYSSYETLRNYFYVLSNKEGFYQILPFIDYNSRSINFTALTSNQQYIYSLIYNCFSYLDNLFDIIYNSKRTFKNSLKNYKILIFIIFAVFFAFIMFSLLLLFISIQLSNKKMFKIVEKILKLTKKGKNFLEEKLKYTKKLILNEITMTNLVQKLKEIDPKHKAKKKKNNIDPGTGEYLPSSEIDDDQEDMYLIKFTNNFQKKIYYFSSYCRVLKTLIFLGSIYLIYAIIAFPLLTIYFDKLKLKRKQTENICDFQDIITEYYLQLRYAILLNNTNIVDDTFREITENLYSNYTELKKLLLKENNKDTINFLNNINADGTDGCSYILEDDEFKDALMAVCTLEHMMGTKVETMLSGLINQLRREFINFNQSEKTKEDIIIYYHSRTFQFNNLNFIVFFKNYFKDIEYDYILPQFKNTIDNLTTFLVLIFFIMVITEIFYYIFSNLFVIGELSSSLNNFKIFEKFFCYEENINIEKNNKK